MKMLYTVVSLYPSHHRLAVAVSSAKAKPLKLLARLRGVQSRSVNVMCKAKCKEGDIIATSSNQIVHQM